MEEEFNDTGNLDLGSEIYDWDNISIGGMHEKNQSNFFWSMNFK